jgi:hypothetical protein
MKIKLISAAVRSRSKWSQIMTLSLPAVAAVRQFRAALHPSGIWYFPLARSPVRPRMAWTHRFTI